MEREDPLAHVMDTVNPLRHVKGVFYGWWLVGVSGVVMTVGAVPLFYGMAAWFPVLERYFGWNRAQLALAFSFTRAEGSISGPLGGYLIDRVGSRRMVLIGLLIAGGGFLFYGRVQNLWQFYLAFLIVSTGTGVGSYLAMMTVLNSWFDRRRATAMSLAIAGTAVGGILIVPALAWSIDPDRFGPERWRDVAAGIGIAILILAFPISRLVRNRPEEYGLRPDGDSGPVVMPEVQQPGAPRSDRRGGAPVWRRAMGSRAFWLIGLGHACLASATIAMMVHIGSMLHIDQDLSLGTVGLVVATYTGVGAVVNVIAGYVGDRAPIRVVTFAFGMVQVVAFGVLLLVHGAGMAFVFAVLHGIGFGGRHPLTMAIRGTYFERRDFASVTGLSMLPGNAMMFVMPVFAGYTYDITESYTIPLITIVVLTFAGSCLFLLLGKPPQRGPTGSVRDGLGHEVS